MSLKQALVKSACLLALSGAGQASAPSEGDSGHAPNLTHSEHTRMRGELERFSHEWPRRGDFEKRRQMFRDRARQRFHDADTDGNGVLSREEWARLNRGAAQHFDQLDLNGDGQLSEHELAQALRRRARMR